MIILIIEGQYFVSGLTYSQKSAGQVVTLIIWECFFFVAQSLLFPFMQTQLSKISTFKHSGLDLKKKQLLKINE